MAGLLEAAGYERTQDDADADLPNVHTESTMLGAAERVVELAGGAS